MSVQDTEDAAGAAAAAAAATTHGAQDASFAPQQQQQQQQQPQEGSGGEAGSKWALVEALQGKMHGGGHGLAADDSVVMGMTGALHQQRQLEGGSPPGAKRRRSALALQEPARQAATGQQLGSCLMVRSPHPGLQI
jgi:hypothetical protein